MPLNHKNKMKSIEVKSFSKLFLFIKKIKLKKGNGSWQKLAFGEIDSFYWKGTPQVENFELRFTLVTGESLTHRVTKVTPNSYIDTKKQF